MIIIKFFKRYKKYFSKVSFFFDDLNSKNDIFITQTFQRNLIRKYKPLYNFFKFKFKNKQIRKFIKLYSNLENYIEIHNSIYFKNQLKSYEDLLNNIDGKSLDLQQKQAVLSDDKNTLIIARRRKWKNFNNFWKS